MNKCISIKACLFILVLFCVLNTNAQNLINWTNNQLIAPSELATIIKSNPKDVIIFSIGPFNTIPGAINIGMISEEDKLDKFKAKLSALKKDQKIVVYCGCCPYEHCPNVRPAINVLKQNGFTNYFLLDLPDNLRINWIDKGYPVVQQ